MTTECDLTLPMCEVKRRYLSCSQALGFACLILLTAFVSLYYISEMPARFLIPQSALSFYPTANEGSSNTKKYLVDGAKCRIPDIDPYDKDVRKFIRTVSHITCTTLQPLTYVEKHQGFTTLKIDSHLVTTYSKQGVSCCYSNVTRGDDRKKPDDAIKISPCVDFKNSVNTTSEFLIVKCVTSKRKKQIYKNGHAVVHPTPELKKKFEDFRPANGSSIRPLNVLLIGVDSISRLNILRTMPRTVEYLNDNGWVELKGYNKIADNTYPNLMAVLTGIEGEAAYGVCHPEKLGNLDNCTFVWSKYQDRGYATAYAEDAASISTFNFHKMGFFHPPTDYYFRPYMLALEKQLKGIDKYGMKYCVGPVSSADRIISYAKEFSTTFVNNSFFGLFWMNTFSHNDLNMPSGMDNAILKFFQELSDRGVNENTIMVFFSDHGIRFGDIRHTKIGWLEERLPFIYVYVPEWFREKFPYAYKNLQINANRLTTPYDLHMTLQDILVIGGRAQSVKQSSGCPKCRSIFSEIDKNRSCADAAISPHWCMCTAYQDISSSNETVQEAAKFMMSQIQKYIDDAGPNRSKKCAKLKLNKIMISQVGQSWYHNETYILLFVETVPGRGKFEATVSVLDKHNDSKPNFKLHSSISRLDSYAGQSGCMYDANLKKYCYCR